MVVVKAKPGESMDRLIARFRKKVLFSGVLQEYKDRERHKTDAERKKEKKYELEKQRAYERRRAARAE